MKRLLIGLIAAVALGVPAAAVADSCANVSRAPAACGLDCWSGHRRKLGLASEHRRSGPGMGLRPARGCRLSE